MENGPTLLVNNFRECGGWTCVGGQEKSIVLMGVLVYFHQVHRIGRGTLQGESLTITRKGIVEFEHAAPEDVLFGDLDMQEDGISIERFSGTEHLQADFASPWLGGAVLKGGGSQEEAEFLSYTELMALIFLVQRILPHEAVEIAGARKYVEHNMQGASRLQRNQQYCQPMAVTEGTEMVMVAFNATNYKRYHKRAQYEPEHIRWEMRKCLAALVLPPVVLCAAGVSSPAAGAAVSSVATWK